MERIRLLLPMLGQDDEEEEEGEEVEEVIIHADEEAVEAEEDGEGFFVVNCNLLSSTAICMARRSSRETDADDAIPGDDAMFDEQDELDEAEFSEPMTSSCCILSVPGKSLIRPNVVYLGSRLNGLDVI